MIGFEVEFLGGVSYASRPDNRAVTEWPPQPDRLFQSLVATWGRNDEPDLAETEALEWLEARNHDALRIDASIGSARDVLIVFVPTNDARTTSERAKSTASLLTRLRQQRYFPAQALGDGEDARVRYLWTDATDVDRHAPALERLAREMTYVGHSSSLVRAAFLRDAGHVKVRDAWIPRGGVPLRVPYPGRLAELRRRYTQRLPANASPVTVTALRPANVTEHQTLFDRNAIVVLADAGGFRPAAEAFPTVAKRLRDALMKIGEDAGIRIPELLSGHAANGDASSKAHVAFIPLSDIGGPFSDGFLRGVAVLFPHEAPSHELVDVRRILRAFIDSDNGGGALHFGRSGSWRLSPAAGETIHALDLTRYTEPSRMWGSVTPVALERYPKNESEIATLLLSMLDNAGVPASVVRHADARFAITESSQFRGAPTIRAARLALAPDSRYRSKRFVHLCVRFGEPVHGPLVLGAGKFRGLGLMHPLPEALASEVFDD